jgi:HlyD family secretion protein
VGTVERTLAELTAPVSEVIYRISVERGQRVAAGEELVRLDPLLAQADLADAEAGVASAQSALTVAEQDLRRAQNLRRTRVASEQDLDRAVLSRDEASARLRSSMARLAAAQKRLDDLILRAPGSGVVDQLPFERGERVPAGAVLVVLLSDDEPWVRVWIPERAAARVAPGTAAEVKIDGISRVLTGRVLDVAREAEFTPHYALTERERVNLVYEARVLLPDAPPELRPGVGAEVQIALPDGPFPPAAGAAAAGEAPSP